jgi:hypothetical protein
MIKLDLYHFASQVQICQWWRTVSKNFILIRNDNSQTLKQHHTHLVPMDNCEQKFHTRKYFDLLPQSLVYKQWHYIGVCIFP